RSQARHRFGTARWIAWWMRVLHPADGWRQLPEMMRALALAQRGEEAAALKIFQRFEGVTTASGLLATVELYRITQRWEGLMEWRREHLSEEVLNQHPGLIPSVLRAFGETGDVDGMLAWFEACESRIERSPALVRTHCRLVIY